MCLCDSWPHVKIKNVAFFGFPTACIREVYKKLVSAKVKVSLNHLKFAQFVFMIFAIHKNFPTRNSKVAVKTVLIYQLLTHKNKSSLIILVQTSLHTAS